MAQGILEKESLNEIFQTAPPQKATDSKMLDNGMLLRYRDKELVGVREYALRPPYTANMNPGDFIESFRQAERVFKRILRDIDSMYTLLVVGVSSNIEDVEPEQILKELEEEKESLKEIYGSLETERILSTLRKNERIENFIVGVRNRWKAAFNVKLTDASIIPNIADEILQIQLLFSKDFGFKVSDYIKIEDKRPIIERFDTLWMDMLEPYLNSETAEWFKDIRSLSDVKSGKGEPSLLEPYQKALQKYPDYEYLFFGFIEKILKEEVGYWLKFKEESRSSKELRDAGVISRKSKFTGFERFSINDSILGGDIDLLFSSIADLIERSESDGLTGMLLQNYILYLSGYEQDNKYEKPFAYFERIKESISEVDKLSKAMKDGEELGKILETVIDFSGERMNYSLDRLQAAFIKGITPAVLHTSIPRERLFYDELNNWFMPILDTAGDLISRKETFANDKNFFVIVWDKENLQSAEVFLQEAAPLLLRIFGDPEYEQRTGLNPLKSFKTAIGIFRYYALHPLLHKYKGNPEFDGGSSFSGDYTYETSVSQYLTVLIPELYDGKGLGGWSAYNPTEADVTAARHDPLKYIKAKLQGIYNQQISYVLERGDFGYLNPHTQLELNYSI